jgi:REP element-mobilizing transposase RayT
MARALRTDFSGAVHHVTSRGNERRPIFVDDRDREMFLQFLGRAVVRFGWSLSAYVLMTKMIRRCEREFAFDGRLLGYMDSALAILRV